MVTFTHMVKFTKCKKFQNSCKGPFHKGLLYALRAACIKRAPGLKILWVSVNYAGEGLEQSTCIVIRKDLDESAKRITLFYEYE